MNRTVATAIIPTLLFGIVFTNHFWAWVPETVAGLNLWRIMAVCFGLWLFCVALFSHHPVAGRRLARARVECLSCGAEVEIADWMRRGACRACGGSDYEFVGRPAWRNAQYLPGAVKLPDAAPAPEPPTPIARPAHKPRGRLLQPVDLARTRLGLAEQRRVRSRVADVLVERRKVARV